MNIPVALGMRYGSMSIKKAIHELRDQGVDEILMVPLYPHYAMSSYETVVVKAEQIISDFFPDIKMDAFPVFYNNKDLLINGIETNCYTCHLLILNTLQ